MKIAVPIYYKYITKEFFFSFVVCFCFFFFIFFVNQILLLAEHILAKKIPVKEVLLLLVYFMPAMVSLSFPFATLVAALMTTGRLSSDNEILAFQASGIRFFQIFLPFLMLSILLSSVSFFINDYFLPKGTINYIKLYRKLIYSNPELELEPYSIKRYQDTVLVTGNVRNKRIDDLIIIDKDSSGNRRFITADKAFFLEDRNNRGIISLNLDNVFTHSDDVKKELDYSYLISEKMIYNILLSDISVSIRNPGPREMSSVDVYKSIREKQENLEEKKKRISYSNETNYLSFASSYLKLSSETTDSNKKRIYRENMDKAFKTYKDIKYSEVRDRPLQIYKLEYQKKFALPLSCFFLSMFALPAGLFTRRSGKSVGFGLGLIVSVFYWCLLFAGHTLGIRSYFNPVLSMWMPNLIISIMAATLYIKRFIR